MDNSEPSEENFEPEPKKFKCEISSDLPNEQASDPDDVTKSAESCENVFLIQPERSVGITEFLNQHEGFQGVLKHRYSDFIVNEINLQKEVVHLTNLKLPIEEDSSEKHVNASEVLSPDIIEKIENLSKRNSSEDVEIQVTSHDKAARTKLHHCLRQNYSNLKSFTKKVGDENFIVVQYCKQGNPVRSRWPSNRPDYTHFVLYKENTDTMEAIRTVADCLKMNPNAFTYAGTKDKRAKTSQSVSVYRVEADKLLRLNNFLRTIKVGNITYQKQAINLGQLFGNRFTVILKNISKTGPEIDEIMRSFAEKGFINYFGLQRFGTTSVPTQVIGRSLVLEDWEKAVQLILEPRKNSEPEDMQSSRRIWWETRDASKALNALRRKNCIEGTLLKGLATHAAKDFLNALNMIPRNTRLLYLHSYQSYIWNCIVSMRIAKMGLTPVEGDLYIINTGEKDAEKKEAEVVTAEVLKAGLVTVYDLVLPLPGHSVKCPENEVHGWYKDLLEKDGITFNSFRTRVKEYSLVGCYRHILVKPENVTWEQIKYDDPNQAMVASDYDKIRPEPCHSLSNSGEKSALKLEFSLPSSAYATMAVREIMKMETTEMVDKENKRFPFQKKE